MRINILFSFKEGPWGGSNQFLKMLKKGIIQRGFYEENPENADIIFLNLSVLGEGKLIKECLRIKEMYPNKIFIQRVDGPISLYRGSGSYIDKALAQINKAFVDGTIFQSEWSRRENLKFGFRSKFERVILNAADGVMFNMSEIKDSRHQGKTKIIATSWSSNMRKGFNYYKFLDNHLDFNRFEMTFVGNSPIRFTNIRQLQPLSSGDLARVLKEHDIFLTASQRDPCSNALIEALSCGLPAVALDSGGHPELVGESGELFSNKTELLDSIKKVADNIEYYKSRIPFNANNASKCIGNYIEFMENIYRLKEQCEYSPKQPSMATKANLYLLIIYLYILSKVVSLKYRIMLWMK